MKVWLLWGVLFSGVVPVACATAVSPYREPFDERFQADLDRRPIPVPRSNDVSSHWYRFEDRVMRRTYDLLDLPAHARAIGTILGLSEPREAGNVNAWGEVPDSTWFTNRIGRRRLSRQELTQPFHNPPAATGPWVVVSGKSDGVTIGFVVRDAKDDVYFLKLDPPGFLEMATGAELFGTLVFHAAGYNVPENYLTRVAPDRFVLDEGATIPGEYGVRRPMTRKDLDDILGSIEPLADGSLRVVASLHLEGKPVGPFRFEGTRPDDPNDRIPHEDRRELRGLHIVSAWIQNTDLRPANTLDMYVGEPGQGYLRHNLLDFGTCLGSAGNEPKTIRDGYEHYVDYAALFRNFTALGGRIPYWSENRLTRYPAVGMFEADAFDPLRWTTQWSNPAYERITDRDAYWATRLVMRFSDADIRALIETAGYTEPAVRDYLVTTLIRRRDKIGATWFRRLTPLDGFHLVAEAGGEPPALAFEDLAETLGPGTRGPRICRARVVTAQNQAPDWQPVPAAGEGRWRLPLARPGQDLRGHLRVELSLVEQGVRVGAGVRVWAYCSSARHCVVAGVKRLYH